MDRELQPKQAAREIFTGALAPIEEKPSSLLPNTMRHNYIRDIMTLEISMNENVVVRTFGAASAIDRGGENQRW